MRVPILRRTAACLLAVCLLIAGLTGPVAPALAGDFESHWAAAEVTRAVEAGWLDARADGLYRPDEPVTRAELAGMLRRLLGLTATADLSGYSDVAPDHPYYADLAAAAAAGILTGYDGRLNPDGPLTRNEAAVIFTRLVGLTASALHDAALAHVPDAADIPDWARPSAAAAVSQGLIAGAAGLFDGERSISRAEILVLLGRLHDGTRVFGFPGTFTLTGAAKQVLLAAVGVQLTLLAPVETLTVLPVAADSQIVTGSGVVVDTMHLQAPATVSGAGLVQAAYVHAAGVTFAAPPLLTVVASGLTALIGGAVVSGTVAAGGGGGSSGGTSGGSSGGGSSGGGWNPGPSQPSGPAVSSLRLIGTHTVEITLSTSVPGLVVQDFAVAVDGVPLNPVVPDNLSPVGGPVWPLGADEFALYQDTATRCRLLLGGGLDAVSAASGGAVTVQVAGTGTPLTTTARTVTLPPLLALSGLAVTDATTLTLTLASASATRLTNADISRFLLDFYSAVAPPSEGASALVPTKLTHTAGSDTVTLTVPTLSGQVGLVQVYRTGDTPLIAPVDFAAPRVSASAALRTGETGGTLSLLLDEDCTLSLALWRSGQSVPTEATLAAGPFLPPDSGVRGQGGLAAVWNLPLLEAGVACTVYFMAKDGAGNRTARLSLPLTAAAPTPPVVTAGGPPAREGLELTAAALNGVAAGNSPFLTLTEEAECYHLTAAADDLSGLTLTLGGIASSAPVGGMVSTGGGGFLALGTATASGRTITLFGVGDGDTVLLYTDETHYVKLLLTCAAPLVLQANGLEAGESATVTVDGQDYTLTDASPTATVPNAPLQVAVAVTATVHPGRSMGAGISFLSLDGTVQGGYTLPESAGTWSVTPTDTAPHLLTLHVVATPPPLTAALDFAAETVTLTGGPALGLYEIFAVPQGGSTPVVQGGLYAAEVALGDFSGLIPAAGSPAVLASFRLSPAFGMPAAEYVTVTLPSRPATPDAGAFSVAPDGGGLVLTGATADLEVSILADGAANPSAWVPCDGADIPVADGDTVRLRVAATELAFASAVLELPISPP